MEVLLFTHKSDIDGMGNAILSKLAFDNVEYILCKNIHDIEKKVANAYQKGTLINYDKIYITDLSISQTLTDTLYNDIDLKNKVFIFDHHASALNNNITKYNNVNIIIKDNNKLTCATEIFYKYLIANKYLTKNKILDDFVELIRNEDTYDWKRTNNIKAHDLALLYQSLGPDNFINNMTKKIKNNIEFNYTEEEIKRINEKKQDIKNHINNYLETLEIIEIDKYKVGVCFINYEYRNEVADYLLDIKTDIDVVAMIALDNSGISLRSIKDQKAARIIAEKYKGGGHDSAANIPITKVKRRSIINTIFKQ